MQEFDQDLAEEEIRSIEIRKLSSFQWTPVWVADRTARLLVAAPGARILDIGGGPGKFYLVAAAHNQPSFAVADSLPV